MEAFKEAIAASMEQSLILKGKRTKRHRTQSPIPFSISPPIEEEPIVLDVENRKKDGHVIMSSSSSASWSEEDKEDQDIANCLILLSQGHQLKIPYQETNRFSSRKFLETSSNDGAKAGYYVYQCKTCDRTFPSFQALGGHRASHKKPKATSFYFNLQNDAVSVVKTPTIYKNNKNRSLVVFGKASNNNKVHECGICGAEFTSGQALGGHMRRHRGAVAPTVTKTTPANTELSLSSMSFDQISDGQNHLVMPVIKKAKKTIVSLDLDLNLPAPEDENRVNRFSFVSRQKQEEEQMKQREETKSLVLSAPTLVDCHY